MRKKNKGFTLIELIIVVAVLAILVGILAPQYTKYVEKSRTAACQANMDSLVRAYQVAALEQAPGTINDARAILEKIVADEKGDDANLGAGTTIRNGGEYAGLCKKKGIYSVLFTEDFLYLNINCSVHGIAGIDAITLKDRLDKITFTDIDGWTCGYTTIYDYFDKKKIPLNSEGKNTDTTHPYGEYSSLAEVVEEKLLNQGLNISDRSWQMYKNDGKYYLILTDHKLTTEDKDKQVNCQWYNITDQEVKYGSFRAVMKDGYMIVDNSKFTQKQN